MNEYISKQINKKYGNSLFGFQAFGLVLKVFETLNILKISAYGTGKKIKLMSLTRNKRRRKQAEETFYSWNHTGGEGRQA